MIIKTNKEYVASANNCPVCNSEHIEGQSFDVDDSYCMQEVTCSSCNSVWHDMYLLQGYEIIELGVIR